MSDNLGHMCHAGCPCEYTEEVECAALNGRGLRSNPLEVIEMTTPLPPVVVWCTTCGGPKPCSCG